MLQLWILNSITTIKIDLVEVISKIMCLAGWSLKLEFYPLSHGMSDL